MPTQEDINLGTLELLMGMVGLGNVANQSGALDIQGKAQRQQYEFSEKLTGIRTEQLRDQEIYQEGIVGRRGAQLIGSQKAAYAASGVEVDSGTPSVVEDQTREAIGMDVNTLRSNAFLEAWGMKANLLKEKQALSFDELARKRTQESLLFKGMTDFGTSTFKAAARFGG